VSRAQPRALVDVVAWGCAAFDVAPRRIRGHRDYAATTCPGGHLGRLIDDGTIRAAVRGRLRHGDVEKVRLCGAAGRRRVRAIARGTD
jgi:hypothetical protein